MTMTHEQSMQFLQDYLYEKLPLTKAMQVQVAAYDGESLVLSAPLASNNNDKGTAFAGSISSLATVCGWGLWMLWAKDHYDECQVAVSHGDIQYKNPITTDFWAKAILPDAATLAHLKKALSHKGKVRAQTYIAVGDDHDIAVSQLAEYALWRKAN